MNKVLGPVGGLIGKALFGNKKAAAPAPVPLPQITPRRPTAASEAIANRRGSAANDRTGGSAESSATGKNRLLGRN